MRPSRQASSRMRSAYGLHRNGGQMREAECVAYVYLLRCADGSLYCGWSTDPERRLRQHQRGTASRYTRRRVPGGRGSTGEGGGRPPPPRGGLPVELVWTVEVEARSAALREEARIKRLSAREKRALVSGAPARAPA